MGSYGNLARRALQTEMPVMVKVLMQIPCSMVSIECLFALWIHDAWIEKKEKKTHVFDNQGGCVCRCRNCSEELRMLCLWPRSVNFFFPHLFPLSNVCFRLLMYLLAMIVEAVREGDGVSNV